MKNIEFMDFKITPREILVSIAITLILIGIGFLISSGIRSSIDESNEKYYKALKIDNNDEIFRYSLKTNVGYSLAQGKVQAVNGVSISDIEGKYFKIIKKKEEYTKHYKKVKHTRTVGNTTETYYTYEEYWTWDYTGEEEWHIEKFNFLGVEFDYGIINFTNEQYKETISGGYHIRYKYYVIPFEFNGTLFTYINNNQINQNTFYYNETIEDIINEKQQNSNIKIITFWFFWIIMIGFIDYFYVLLDNDYLEDKRGK